MHFSLKNAKATFQRTMTFSFHSLKHIIELYLDDLIAHSRMRVDHLAHLRLVFEICRHYENRLNPRSAYFVLGLVDYWDSLYQRRGLGSIS